MAGTKQPQKDRIRMIVDTETTVRNAIRLRHLKRNGKGTLSDIVNEALKRDFADEIAEVTKFEDDSTKKRKT